MFTDLDKEMILKFLERNYPVSRIKTNMRFKRGIVLDDGVVYLLSSESQSLALQHKLFELIIKVFNCDDKTSKIVLDKFLRLK